MGPVIRVCAIVASAIVAVSFLLFAVDQLGEGSANQVEAVRGGTKKAPSQAAINQPAPPPAVERAREARHSSVREYIDDADDVLLSPFTGLIDSDEVWVQRLVPGAIALLLYGLGGMLLANAMPRRSTRTGGDWREQAG